MIDKFGKTLDNQNIKDYTTYKLSGKIKKVIYPENKENLIQLIKYLQQENIKYLIVGNGSNLIFKGDYNGVVIKLDRFDKLIINDGIVTVGAGYNLMKLALKTASLGLSGLEFASGIPATVGGAIYMNAGAYNSSMSDIILEVEVLDDNLNVITLNNNQLKFGYRDSILKNKNYICLNAKLKLQNKNKEEILDLIKTRKQKRLASQPLEFPSAGSVFRNPEGLYAGKLIEDLGLKGKSIGGASISKKHANFIINNGNANGEDVVNLINSIKDKVKEEYDIDLINEQEIIE
ncbi:MAG: UDP-N-acetylmuramate dehydrogenase [Bacilli bacterium]|nr:UDP-N-acetylmuramate dehydrogenase [Bacilli bacterium]